MRAIRRLAPLGLAGLLLAACSAGPSADSSPGATSATTSTAAESIATGDDLSGELVVLAAASLQTTFTELGDLMMAQHPNLTVTSASERPRRWPSRLWPARRRTSSPPRTPRPWSRRRR